MKSNFDPAAHISGYHRPRLLEETERDESAWAVRIPMGFETLDYAVYGHGLSEADACEAVADYRGEPEPEDSGWICYPL